MLVVHDVGHHPIQKPSFRPTTCKREASVLTKNLPSGQRFEK